MPQVLGYRRVALVKRVEYLTDFLEVVNKGYSKEKVEEKLADTKRRFEIEKARAVGRGNPFTQRLKKAAGLVRFTEELSRRIGFVEASDTTYRLTEKGNRFLQILAEGGEPDAFLLDSLLGTYPSFWHVISAINSADHHEVLLPRTTVKSVFAEHAVQYGIQADVWTFDIVRDLCSQLGIVNWFPDSISGQRMQRVFMASKICYDESSRVNIAGFPLHTTIAGKRVKIDRNIPDFSLFKDTVWKEYLITTNYVPRRPVFYSDLRTKVCYVLQMADKIFDRLAGKLMEKDEKYLLLAAGGSLPYSRDSAGMLKSLPPRTPRGQYMVYLKMDERSCHD